MLLNKPPELTSQEVQLWVSMVNDLRRLKAQEMILRKKIAASVIFNNTANTVTKELHGFELRTERKFNYGLDVVKLESISGSLSDAEKDAINWKPSISVGKYKKLSRGLLTELVTIKPSAPTVTLLSTLT